MRTSAIAFAMLCVSATALAADKNDCIAAAEEGQLLKKEGKLVRARTPLLTCARADCPTAVAQDCVQWLQEIDRSIGTIAVQVVDAGGNEIPGARATLDGSEIKAATEVEAGTHVVHAESSGLAPSDVNVVLSAGERRTVVVRLAPPKIDQPKTTTAPSSSAKIPAASWILAGVGIVGLAGFATFGALGLSDQDALRKTCAPRCSDAEVNPVQVKFAVADVALVTGIVALGAAVVVTIFSMSKPRTTGFHGPTITF